MLSNNDGHPMADLDNAISWGGRGKSGPPSSDVGKDSKLPVNVARCAMKAFAYGRFCGEPVIDLLRARHWLAAAVVVVARNRLVCHRHAASANAGIRVVPLMCSFWKALSMAIAEKI